MPRDQIVASYLAGDISRRTFIRRIVASGVSLAAALTYAGILTPRAVALGRGGHCDFYHGHQVLTIPLRDSVRDPCTGERILLRGKLHVVVNVTRTATCNLVVSYHLNYAGISGRGATSGKQYRGGGTQSFQFHMRGNDLYEGGGEMTRGHFVLNGPGKDKFRSSILTHMTVDANGRVHASIHKIASDKCLS